MYSVGEMPNEAPSPSLTNTTNVESVEGSADMKSREGCFAPNALLGHPCAAGCGHHCWVAKDKAPAD